MKLLDIIKTANSNLLRNKGRTGLTILAIFIGCFTIIMTNGINTGVNNYIDKQIESVGGEGYLEVMPKSMASQVASASGFGDSEIQEYDPNNTAVTAEFLTDEDIAKINSVDGIESARAYQVVSVEYITSSVNNKKYLVEVAEIPSDGFNVDMASGKIVNSSEGYQTPEITLSQDYVNALGFSNDQDAVGKKVSLAVKDSVTGEISLIEVTISGIMNPSVVSLGRNWINSAANNLAYQTITAKLPEAYKNQAYFAVAQIDDNHLSDEDVETIKNQIIDMGYHAMTTEDQVGMVKSFFSAITTVLTIFGVIALIAASIGIINTLFMSVQERTREIGLMKAIGLSQGKIFLIFSLEAISLGFWGSIVGIIVAFITRAIANHLATTTFLKGLPGFTLVEFELANLVIFVLVVMLIAFLAGTLPARRAAKQDPINALRYE